MAKSIKTLFMDAVKVDLDSITDINQVKRGQAIAIDPETAVFPYASFYTNEVTKTVRNRVQVLEFDLIFWVWIQEGSKTIEEQADDLDAEIETKILKNGTVLSYASKINPVSSDTFYVDDMITGILQAIYRITLLHEYGDATNLGK